MKAIYEPGGRALEYSPLALNLYTGCTHRCSYCFAADNRFVDKEKFHGDVKPRNGILKAIERDCKRMEGDPRAILLCFHCDPYPPAEVEDVTRRALNILAKYNMTAQVLTKGGRRAIRDFDILKQDSWQFGTTLSLMTDARQQKWEPNAATIHDRCMTIMQAHKAGIHTWVSVEPVVHGGEALDVIEYLLPSVDFWKIGKMNHRKEII